jgi:hypothetical protein
MYACESTACSRYKSVIGADGIVASPGFQHRTTTGCRPARRSFSAVAGPGGFTELRWLKDVVPQQMEHDDMASDNGSERTAPARDPRKDIHSIPASPQAGPPNLSGGLESPRSSHC